MSTAVLTRLVSALAVALTLTGAAAGQVRYIAFGDSNTRGNDCVDDPGASDPPDFVFDDGPGCLPTTPCNMHGDEANDCGYAYRLEEEIAGGVPDAVVINAGSGGETVAEGLSRLDSRISPGDDVLILIHGTNDISNFLRGDPGSIPPEDVANIMGLMIDKATEIGMDTLIGSPIHRVCPQFPAECPGFIDDPPHPDDPRPEAWPDDPTTADLDRDIDAVAEGRNRKSISPWFRIGKDQAEVDTWYFQEDLRFGHIRPSGYVRLTDDPLARNITGNQGDDALGAPNPVSPMGDTDDSGVFVWDDYPNPETGARLWQLQVDGPLGGAFHDQFYEATDVCVAGVCTVDIGTLDVGDYSWKVRGKNLRGPSPFSADTPFTVTPGPVPGETSLIYPLDQVYQVDPPFRWTEAELATDYRLLVDGDETLVSSTACVSGICTATRGVDLAFGFHAWQVQPFNENGDGPSTPLESFDVLECTMPFDLVLDADDVGTGAFFTTCDQIQARDGYRIQSGEAVTLWAGEEVVLFDSFVVESGGSLTAGVDH